MRHLAQEAPLRALFPGVEPDEAPEAAIVNTGGGVVGGDHYAIDVEVEPGAALTITTPAAEKIYRSAGEHARIETRLRAADGARLEWLPQETILFDEARLRRRLDIDLAPTARFLGVEILLFGRRASGEWLSTGALRDSWMLRIGGRLVWADAFGLDGYIAARRAAPFGIGDAAGYATILVAGPTVAELYPLARQCAAGAASLVNGVLLLRFLDNDAARLRGMVIEALAALRPAAGGRGGAPRLWMS
ncbi:urease accessory protein UreD [Methylosinus sp. Sm6]|uniref:urease accessory protein UreD n=1 Tax=Methylosinus sp. Sm6 TaxID=2866948 RepID=UPI002105D469|nr:urease accessory protein UreD [Methylosinus sp. Sm6]